MKKSVLQIVLLSLVFLVISIQAQTTYLKVERFVSLNKNGKTISKSYPKDLILKLSAVNLIVGGGETYWFYGQGTIANKGSSFIQTATYELADKTLVCRITLEKASPSKMYIKIEYISADNLQVAATSVYECSM